MSDSHDSVNGKLPDEGDVCERVLYVIDEMIAGSVEQMDEHEQGTKEWSFWNGSGNALLQLREFVVEECEEGEA
jgi:hypothetical protein